MRERKVKKRGNLRKSPWQAFKGKGFYSKFNNANTLCFNNDDKSYKIFEDAPRVSGRVNLCNT